MYVCFICSDRFINVDVLCVHYKYNHHLKSADRYNCAQSSCPQTFTSLRSLKAHLKSLHLTETTTLSNEQKPLQIQHKHDPKPLSARTQDESKPKIMDAAEFRRTMDQHALSFVLQLSSKSHLTNAQIEDIMRIFASTIGTAYAMSYLNQYYHKLMKNRSITCLKYLKIVLIHSTT